MNVISEEKLCGYLNRVLSLSRDVLAAIPQQGTQPPADHLLDGYTLLVNDLTTEGSHESKLRDESWNWIWEGKPDMNTIQLYGRLAWINLQLLDLL